MVLSLRLIRFSARSTNGEVSVPFRRRPPNLRGRTPRPQPKPLAPLRVSVVRYLNTAPLVWGLEHGRPRLRYRLNLSLIHI